MWTLKNISLTKPRTWKVVQLIFFYQHLRSKSPIKSVKYLLKLVVDGLVLHDPDPRHLLEHLLPGERLQAVDLQLGVPEVLQRLRRLVDLLKYQNNFFRRFMPNYSL